MYQALYRKYRPQTFDDLVGQLAVSQTLKTQLVNGRLSHAYLFTGSRGTGKTSSAKILAKAVNCENPIDGNPCNCCDACRAIDSGACMDVLEIDAASNNGVDNVRDLRDGAVYTPSQVKKRVYIIDEVHMLSISAFNALLKIIEEPPEHLLFILATTELHKVPATILSRCQRFSFRRISQEDIVARLQYVAYMEGIDLDDSAARVLARLADGALRDGLSLLDQCASAINGELTADRVYGCLGIAGTQDCGRLIMHIANQDTSAALSLLNRLYADGKDMGALLDEIACLVRDIMVIKTAPKEGISMLSGVSTDDEVYSLSEKFSYGELVRMAQLIQLTMSGASQGAGKRMDAELCIVRMCQPELTTDTDSILSRLTRIEEQLRSGAISVSHDQTDSEQTKKQICEIEHAAENNEEIISADFEIEDQAPVGFWTEVATAVRKELRPPAAGFFITSPNAPIQGSLVGDKLVLLCVNQFALDIINKPEVLELVARKATARLGRPVKVAAVDKTASSAGNAKMEKLLQFGRVHGDIINIKDK